MDLHLGEDLYDSFVEYQKRLLREFETMVEPYNFEVIEASASIEEVFAEETKYIESILRFPQLRKQNPNHS